MQSIEEILPVSCAIFITHIPMKSIPAGTCFLKHIRLVVGQYLSRTSCKCIIDKFRQGIIMEIGRSSTTSRSPPKNSSFQATSMPTVTNAKSGSSATQTNRCCRIRFRKRTRTAWPRHTPTPLRQLFLRPRKPYPKTDVNPPCGRSRNAAPHTGTSCANGASTPQAVWHSAKSSISATARTASYRQHTPTARY